MTETVPKYLYNPKLSLTQQFDYLRNTIRPERYEDKAIASAMEKLYDAIAPVAQQYRETLASDDPLALYLNYFLRPAIDIMDDDVDDEVEEPVLFATIPLGTEAIQTKVGKITALSTVRITHASPLGDVGITSNLSASRGYETRVFWDSLKDYRVTAKKEVKNDE
jgi:hypothetical protein